MFEQRARARKRSEVDCRKEHFDHFDDAAAAMPPPFFSFRIRTDLESALEAVLYREYERSVAVRLQAKTRRNIYIFPRRILGRIPGRSPRRSSKGEKKPLLFISLRSEIARARRRVRADPRRSSEGLGTW